MGGLDMVIPGVDFSTIGKVVAAYFACVNDNGGINGHPISYTLYTDPLNPGVGVPVPFCTTVGAGVADPHPCIDGHTITQPSPNSFTVTFVILYLSGDPSYGRR